jgi:hypothetical protein
MTAVNVVFAQGGPQLGEFEAGLVAHAFGPAASVVSGGLACLVVTGWIAWKAPILRNYGLPDVVIPAGSVRPPASASLPAVPVVGRPSSVFARSGLFTRGWL